MAHKRALFSLFFLFVAVCMRIDLAYGEEAELADTMQDSVEFRQDDAELQQDGVELQEDSVELQQNDAELQETSMELRQDTIAEVQNWLAGLGAGTFTLYVAEDVNLGSVGFTVNAGAILSVTSATETDSTITRSGAPSDALFNVKANGELIVSNVTFNGGATGGTSPLISSLGTVRIQDGATLRNNKGPTSAVYSSGLLFVTGGAITGNSNTSSNLAFNTMYGGGIYVKGGTGFTMSGGSISGNKAPYGGGVAVSGCTFEMSGGTISGNDATTGTGFGGGIYSTSKLVLSGGTIGDPSAQTGNAAKNGGGIYASGTLTIEGGEVVGNKASASGGGIAVRSCTVSMTDGTVSKNTAKSNGGGFFFEGGSYAYNSTLSGGVISDNIASGNGGGVYIDVNWNASLSDEIVISRNTAGSGAGVYANLANLNMSGGEISDNKVTSAGQGGGIYYVTGNYNPEYTLQMSGGLIKGNTVSGSSGNGGGICLNGGTTSTFTFKMTGGEISGNKNTGAAAGNGGGIYVQAGTAWITGGTITGNSAKNGGGICLNNNSSAKLHISGTPLVGVDDADNGVFLYTGKFMSIIDPLTDAFRINISGMSETAPVNRVVARKEQAAGTISDAEAAHLFYQKEGYAVIPLPGSTTDYVVNAAPVFISHPGNETVNDGVSATFSVELKTLVDISLQWERSIDGGESWQTLGSETDASLAFAAHRSDDGTLYRCVATNAYMSVASQTALLTVAWLDILENPQNQTVDEGEKARFSVSADINPGPPLFQWEVSVDGGTTWTQIPGQTGSVLDVEGAGMDDAGNRYRCWVSNGLESACTDFAVLDVLAQEPGKPDDPDDPDDPEDPEDPDGPDDPDDPNNPIGPDDPADPDNPIDPDDPGNPGKPTDPSADPSNSNPQPLGQRARNLPPTKDANAFGLLCPVLLACSGAAVGASVVSARLRRKRGTKSSRS